MDFFNNIKENEFLYLSYMGIIIIIASTLDFIFGWTNARFNKKVPFKSHIALYGIFKKMMYFLVITLFSFVAFLLLPFGVALSVVTTLSVGYIVTEFNSILSHLDLTDDGKKGDLFITMMKRVFGSEEDK